MSGVYPAYFEDGPLVGQQLDMMRDDAGAPSAMIVAHHAPSMDIEMDIADPRAIVPERVVYYLDRKGKVVGGKLDGLELYIYRLGADDTPEEHPEHQEPTA